MMSVPVWLLGPMFLLGGVCPSSHVPSAGRFSVCGLSSEESLSCGSLSRGVSVDRHPGIRKACRTHRARMLSCR